MTEDHTIRRAPRRASRIRENAQGTLLGSDEWYATVLSVNHSGAKRLGLLVKELVGTVRDAPEEAWPW